MYIREKVIETAADLRIRAKASFDTLRLASRKLEKVARHHGSLFVEQNSSLMRAAGKDVSTLARATFAQVVGSPAAAARKGPVKRKRATAKVA